MRKQWIAPLLALALALSLCAIPALAQTDTDPPAEEAGASGENQAPGEDGTSAEDEAPGKDEAPAEGEAPQEAPEEAPPAAGDGGNTIVVRPDGEPLTTARESGMDDELVFTGEDDFRYLAFEDLRDKVLEGSLTARMLQESIASIDATDYTDLYQSLNAQMQSLEAMQMMYAQTPAISPMESAMQGYIISNLASSYASLNNSVSDLASGKLQEDSAAARRQLKNAQELTVVGAESLYFAILELEQTKATLQRNMTALDRQLEEMELRYELGPDPGAGEERQSHPPEQPQHPGDEPPAVQAADAVHDRGRPHRLPGPGPPAGAEPGAGGLHGVQAGPGGGQDPEL